MDIKIIIPEKIYKPLRQHLFKGVKEQGAYLFATEKSSPSETNLIAEDIYLIPAEAWDVQGEGYLELSEEEKVKIMIMARKRDCHLVECHSHRSPYGVAQFSPSDIKGLNEFVTYVRWKLPGKKYAALVWTRNSVSGMMWDGQNTSSFPVKEVRILMEKGKYRTVKPSPQLWEKFFNWAKFLKRGRK